MLSAAPLLIIKGVEVLKFWVLASFLNQTGLECLKKAQKNKSSFSETPNNILRQKLSAESKQVADVISVTVVYGSKSFIYNL